MEPIHIEGGEVLANLEDRTITGLVIPYGEMGRTNVGQFMVEAGVIALPEDPEAAVLNLDHDRFQPVGNGQRFWETPAGIMASLRVAKGPRGDAALADARNPEGKRRRLSGEFLTGIKNGKATGGHLAGVGLVEMGAFPSAMVLASDTPDPEPTTPPTPAPTTTPEATPAEDYQKEADVPEPITPAVAQVTPAATPAPATIPGAPVLATLETPAAVAAEAVELSQVYAAMAALKTNPHDTAALGVLAAIVDIKTTGLGANTLQPNFLGPIISGAEYVRQYIVLGNLGTDIYAGGKSGYKTRRGTSGAPLGLGETPTKGVAPNDISGEWLGNKTEINSYNGFADLVQSTLRKFAVGNDIAREFVDLPGGAEVVQAFLALLVEDYLWWSDQVALSAFRQMAGAPVAPIAPPEDGAGNPKFSQAITTLIQAIRAAGRKGADGRRVKPTFAIANEALWDELVYTPKDELPEFINLAVDGQDDTGTADGVTVVEGEVGIENTAAALAGARSGVDFDEVPNGPIRVDAVDLAKGGVDRAVHGYVQVFPRRPEAFVLVGTADA
jgi:hypothetical protein